MSNQTAKSDLQEAAERVDAALEELWTLLPEGCWEDAPYSRLALAGHRLHQVICLACSPEKAGLSPRHPAQGDAMRARSAGGSHSNGVNRHG